MARAAALAAGVLYLILGFAYVLRTPLWQAPDEPAHFNYIEHIADGEGLPVLREGDYDQTRLENMAAGRFRDGAVETLRYEAHQPPLYYLLMTPVSAAARGQLTALRFASLLLGLLPLAAAWMAGRQLFPESPTAAAAMVGALALLPQRIAIDASVNNDVLAETVASGLLVCSLFLLRPHSRLYHSWQGPAVAGLLMGAAFLTKTTVFAAAALPLMAWTLAGRPRGRAWPAIATGVALAIGAVWWSRNLSVYGGADLLGLARHGEVVAGQPQVSQWTLPIVREALTTMFQSFWLQLGWMAAPAESWVYRVLAVINGIILAGAAVAVWRLGRRSAGASPPPGGEGGAGPLALCGTLLLLTIVQTAAYNVQFLQPQGRYLFPALIPIGAFAVAGLRELAPPRWFSPAAWATGAGLLGLNVYALLVVIPLL